VQQFCFAQHVSGHHRHVLQFIDGLHLSLIQPTHSILVRMGFEALHESCRYRLGVFGWVSPYSYGTADRPDLK
jgi:hypothetical protein